MIYMRNIQFRTAKSASYLGNAGPNLSVMTTGGFAVQERCSGLGFCLRRACDCDLDGRRCDLSTIRRAVDGRAGVGNFHSNDIVATWPAWSIADIPDQGRSRRPVPRSEGRAAMAQDRCYLGRGKDHSSAWHSRLHAPGKATAPMPADHRCSGKTKCPRSGLPE